MLPVGYLAQVKQLTDYLPVRDSAGMEADYCGHIHR